MSILIKGVEMPIDGMLCIDIFPDGRVAGHYDCTIKQAKAVSAADVQPVVRALRILHHNPNFPPFDYQLYQCSACFGFLPNRANFCPNCGAKMEE